MLVNADFSRRATVSGDEYQWVASPQSGVERVMLDRVGGEKARATSIVRYAPGGAYPEHAHPGGEEILVLSGTFSEGAGHYPAGWYLRNPPGSRHQPFTHEGATIFVKLWQMAPADTNLVRIDTRDPARWHQHGGREVCPLYADGAEVVSLQRVVPGEVLLPDALAGAELLVLSGHVVEQGQAHGTGSWMRFPMRQYGGITAGAAGATVYLKTGLQAVASGRA